MHLFMLTLLWMADGYGREFVWKEMLTSAVIFVRKGQAGVKRVQESGESELPHFRNKRSQDIHQ